MAAIAEIAETIGHMTEISNAIAASVQQQGAATAEIPRNVGEAADGTQAMTRKIMEVRFVAGETDVGAEAGLAAAEALGQEADAFKSTVKEFLATLRSAA